MKLSALSNSRKFSSLRKETSQPVLTVTPHSVLLSPWQLLICSLSLWICLILDVLCKRNHLVCDFLCLASLTEHNMVKVHSCWSLCHCRTLFCVEYSSMVWAEQTDHPSLILSSTAGSLGHFPLLAVAHDAAVDICVHFFFTPIFSCFGSTPMSRIGGSHGNLIFT